MRSGCAASSAPEGVPYNATLDLGDIQLGPPAGTATIKGVVSVFCGTEQPAPSAQVMLEGICRMTTTSDAEGRYEFKNAPHGYFQVKGDSRGAYRFQDGAYGTAEAGQTTTVDFVFNGWGVAEGLARYANGGADNSGIKVVFDNLLYNLKFSDVTDPDGRYQVPTLCGTARIYLVKDPPNQWDTWVDVRVPFNGTGTASTVLMAP